MKYSLRDFRRAADRHMGDMQPSKQCRARLTRRVHRRPSPTGALGWVAAVAACLVMVTFMNMSVPREPGGALPSASPALAAQPYREPIPSPDPAHGLASDPASDSEPSPEPGSTAGAFVGSDRLQTALHSILTPTSAHDSALLALRSDERPVYTTHDGREYFIADQQVYLDPSFALTAVEDAAYFYTLDEVLSTEAGRAFYGTDNASDIQMYGYTLWPRDGVATLLPGIDGATWVRYYCELDVGIVQSNADYDDGLARYALANTSGLLTGFDYVYIYGYTEDGVTLASTVLSEEQQDGYTRLSHGVLNARGEWASDPIPGDLDTLSAELLDNGEVVPVYYLLRTYENLDLKYDDSSSMVYLVIDYGNTLIMDLSGNVIMTVGQFGYMFTSVLGDAPIPYQDANSGLWGYLDIDMNIAIPAQYLSAHEFGGGLAAVQVASDGEWSALYGFIDAQGNMVISPQYAFVLSGFDDEGGAARVWTTWDGAVSHAIDRTGADVSNPLWLMWQRISEQPSCIPMNGRLSAWGIALMAIALFARRRLDGYPDGYGAEVRRLIAGYGGYVGFVLMYGALDEGVRAVLPGLMLAGGMSEHELAAYVLVLLSALVGGWLHGWALRARRQGMGLVLSCALAALMPVCARYLMCMCTRMDVDVTVALALGLAVGAVRGGARDAEPTPRALRAICMALSAAICLGAIALDPHDMSRRNWQATALTGQPQLELSALSDPDSLARLRAHAERADIDAEYLAAVYGDDWQQQLDALLAAPEGYALLSIDIPLVNPYLRAQRMHAYAYITGAPGADSDIAAEYVEAVLASMNSDACMLWPLASGAVRVTCLVRTGDAPIDEWLEGFRAHCTVNIGLY